ncbi:MAG TPA: MFS transporter [Verrucomicrobiae bacterium]|nr:MFS transporter [Verrucomicrobiae bacterium]
MSGSTSGNTDDTAARPTRVRYRVVAMAVLLAMVTYLDRVCISKLAPDIMHDLGLSKVQMGWVFSAFALAYAIFEIPTAWWADRRGTRRVLTRIVIWWSSFTIATAGAFNYASLLVLRFLFGVGEAGAWPSVAKTFSRWIPDRERGTIQGIFFTGAHLAGGLAPLLVVALLRVMHWRMIFVCFGVIGFLWALAWYRWFRDDPSEHRAVNAEELRRIVTERRSDGEHAAVGWAYWRRLLGSPNMWALCVMYFPNSFSFYFCITWLPTYLQEKGSFDPTMLGFLAGLPLLLSVASDLFGGITTDWATRRFGLRWGRCGVGAAAYLIAGVTLIVAAASRSPMLSAIMISLATAASMFTLGASWSAAIEMGRNHAGVVSAAMNTSGQIGSLLCPLIVAYSVQWFSNWNLPLYLMGGLFLVGVVCWGLLDPLRPIFGPTEDES